MFEPDDDLNPLFLTIFSQWNQRLRKQKKNHKNGKNTIEELTQVCLCMYAKQWVIIYLECACDLKVIYVCVLCMFSMWGTYTMKICR